MNASWEVLRPSDIRQEVHKAIYVVIVELVEQRNFRIRRQGHKIALYCPCAVRGGFITVGGTVRDGDVAATRLRRAATKCPGRHELMR